MKERIFFISPLSEDEEEEKFPYDKYGNTTAMAYYDEHGNTIETDSQEQPKEEPTIEKIITIIYEASKPKVITEQTHAPEAMPIFPISEETQAAAPYPGLKEYFSADPYPELSEYFTRDPYPGAKEYFSRDPYLALKKYIGGTSPTEVNQLASIRSELQEMTSVSGAPAPHAGELQAAA